MKKGDRVPRAEILKGDGHAYDNGMIPARHLDRGPRATRRSPVAAAPIRSPDGGNGEAVASTWQRLRRPGWEC